MSEEIKSLIEELNTLEWIRNPGGGIYAISNTRNISELSSRIVFTLGVLFWSIPMDEGNSPAHSGYLVGFRESGVKRLEGLGLVIPEKPSSQLTRLQTWRIEAMMGP